MDELQNVLKNYRLLTPDASGRHPSAMLADTIEGSHSDVLHAPFAPPLN